MYIHMCVHTHACAQNYPLCCIGIYLITVSQEVLKCWFVCAKEIKCAGSALATLRADLGKKGMGGITGLI